MSKALAVGVVLVVVTTSAGRAAAFSYESPGDCPDRTAFEEMVAQRTMEAIPDDLAVRITREEDGHRGELSVGEGRRVLTIDRCDELVEALALSVALQLERQRHEGARAPVEPPEPSRAETIDETQREETIDETMELPRAGEAAEPERVGAFARIVGGVSLMAWFGRGRGARAEPAVHVGVERIDGWWSMAAILSAWRVTSGELVESGPGNARFSIAAGRVSACPLGYDGGWWSAHPCLTLEVGSISGEGELDVPGRDDDTWLAAGLLAWTTLRPLPPLTLHAAAGVAMPFTRYRLRFEQPVRVIYELPAVGAHVGGGIGLSWP